VLMALKRLCQSQVTSKVTVQPAMAVPQRRTTTTGRCLEALDHGLPPNSATIGWDLQHAPPVTCTILPLSVTVSPFATRGIPLLSSQAHFSSVGSSRPFGRRWRNFVRNTATGQPGQPPHKPHGHDSIPPVVICCHLKHPPLSLALFTPFLIRLTFFGWQFKALRTALEEFRQKYSHEANPANHLTSHVDKTRIDNLEAEVQQLYSRLKREKEASIRKVNLNSNIQTQGSQSKQLLWSNHVTSHVDKTRIDNLEAEVQQLYSRLKREKEARIKKVNFEVKHSGSNSR
jgi:hypothetical protein